MKVLIQNIKVTDRVRKEIIKIDELAADIRINGLINPITVMSGGDDEYRLLAGLRRLRACESMGLLEIDVNVVSPANAEAELRIEIGENEQREPFTFSEKMNFARLIEEIEKAKAQERMLTGKHIVDPVNHGTQGCGRSRDIVGSKIGMSGVQYDRAKYVAENATDEVKEELDKGERSIRGTYDELRSKKKAKKEPVEVSENIVPKKNECEEAAEISGSEFEPETSDLDTESKEKDNKYEEKSIKPSKISTAAQKLSKPHNMAGLLSKEDEEAIRRNNEFNAMPPLEKVKELQRQLKEERVRAARAESELSRIKELHHNAVYHKDGIITNLTERLEESEARIRELEAKCCTNDGI